VQAGTLRNWEERYGLLRPGRTPGGTRLYSPHDIRRVRAIQDQLGGNGNSLLAVAQSLRVRTRSRRSPERAERRLRARRAADRHFRLIVDHSPSAIITADPSGRILDWNPQAEKTFGWASQEIVGRSLSSSIIPQFPGFLETGERTVRGRVVETSALHRDGHEFPIEVAVSRASMERGQAHFVCFARDITRRKRAESLRAMQVAVTRALAATATLERAGPAVLEVICHNLGCALGELWIVDREARILRWLGAWHPDPAHLADWARASQGLEVATGVGLPGRVWAGGEPEVVLDLTQDPAILGRAAAGQANFRSALAFPILGDAEVIGVMAFFAPDDGKVNEDIKRMMADIGSQLGQYIERQRAEVALEASRRAAAIEARVAEAASASLDLDTVLQAICRETVAALGVNRVSIMLADAPGSLRRAAEAGEPSGPNGVQTYAIPLELAAKLRLGRAVSSAQFREENPAALEAGLARFGIADFLMVPLGRAGKLAGTLNLVDLRKRGRFGPADMEMAEAIARHAQLAIANALAYRDQQQALRRLDEVNRMKSTFLATMRHELRTPLNAILGFSDLLESRVAGELTPKQQRYVGNIRQSGDHLLRLVDDILEYSALQSKEGVEREPLVVGALIHDVAASLTKAASSKAIRLEVELAERLPPFWGDRNRLGRALRQLIENALKFTETGGRVTIRARCTDEFEISVEDTGPGIAPEDRERIFQPFVQGDSSRSRLYEGTGLGLPMAATIAQLHGGAITVDSVPGRGSTFTVRLPLAPESIPKETAGENPDRGR